MPYLILVRHGQSQWNAVGLWTGHTDVGLTKTGFKEARLAARAIKNLPIHKAHVSTLKRAKQTLAEIRRVLKLDKLPVAEHAALNERHYGEYTGKNKWQVQKQVGDETFKKIRRSWDHPIPGGESLKQVYKRLIPYYEKEILKDLKEGKNVLVSAHGNSMRALVKHLDRIADDKIADLEIATGEVNIYLFSREGHPVAKEIRGQTVFSGRH